MVQKYTHAMWGPKWLPRFIPKLLLRGLTVQVERDIPIWSYKAFQQRPPYSKLDSNIPKFRRWYSQFYSDDSLTFEEARQQEENQFYEW
jgi:cholesterol 7-dehydrogenase